MVKTRKVCDEKWDHSVALECQIVSVGCAGLAPVPQDEQASPESTPIGGREMKVFEYGMLTSMRGKNFGFGLFKERLGYLDRQESAEITLLLLIPKSYGWHTPYDEYHVPNEWLFQNRP